MKLSKPLMKWLLSLAELLIFVGVIAFIVIMLRNMHPPASVQDYLIVIIGLIFGLAIVCYLALLWVADFPPNESSLINQVYDPAVNGPLNFKDRLGVRIGDFIREDKRLLQQAKRASEKPQNASLIKEVLKKVNHEKSRRQREIILRYALMTLDSRDKIVAKANQQSKIKKNKK